MARTTGSVGAETAERVRAIALRLFARHGYAAVSMRQLASNAHLQVGALYNHFAHKQDLLRSVMVGHLATLLREWEARMPADAGPKERLAEFVRFHVKYHATRADEVFISYMELRNLEPDSLAEVEKLRNRYQQSLLAILEEGVRRKCFGVVDTKIAAMAIIAMLAGVTSWYRPEGRLSLDQIADMHVRLVLRSVSAESGGGKNQE